MALSKKGGGGQGGCLRNLKPACRDCPFPRCCYACAQLHLCPRSAISWRKFSRVLVANLTHAHAQPSLRSRLRPALRRPPRLALRCPTR
jgi:hypothetical protein